MKALADAFGVQLQEVTTETAVAIKIIEGYHAPLGLAYELARADTNCQISNQKALRPTVFAVTCMVGPETFYQYFVSLRLLHNQVGNCHHRRDWMGKTD